MGMGFDAEGTCQIDEDTFMAKRLVVIDGKVVLSAFQRCYGKNYREESQDGVWYHSGADGDDDNATTPTDTG